MISVTNVSKSLRYRGRQRMIVDQLNLSIPPGQIIGLVGPNGAGKTTTLRMLSTLTTPSSGSITVDGYDTTSDADSVRRRIGYVPQQGGILPESRVFDELLFQGSLFGMSRRVARARAEILVADFDLIGFEDRTARQLSGGQRRRVDIALGLMQTPTAILLDEPTVGLDPQSRAGLWHRIRALRDEFGTTVIVATHYLDEAERLTDRVAVIDGGKIIADGTPTELISTLGSDEIMLEVCKEVDLAAVLTALGREFESTVSGRRVTIRAASATVTAPRVMHRLSVAGIGIEGLEITRATLDTIFLGLTGRSLRD